MTTPDERRRALRWVPEQLRMLALSPEVSAQDRAQALALLEAYPHEDQLAALDVSPQEESFWNIDVMDETWELFRRITWQTNASERIKYALRVTLRHFPEPAETLEWRRCAAEGCAIGSLILRTYSTVLPPMRPDRHAPG
jgi:hypothetical protein